MTGVPALSVAAIPFNRHFYVFKPPRELHEIDEELKGVTSCIMTMLERLSE
jgi:type I restriction enzyme M protein